MSSKRTLFVPQQAPQVVAPVPVSAVPVAVSVVAGPPPPPAGILPPGGVPPPRPSAATSPQTALRKSTINIQQVVARPQPQQPSSVAAPPAAQPTFPPPPLPQPYRTINANNKQIEQLVQDETDTRAVVMGEWMQETQMISTTLAAVSAALRSVAPQLARSSTNNSSSGDTGLRAKTKRLESTRVSGVARPPLTKLFTSTSAVESAIQRFNRSTNNRYASDVARLVSGHDERGKCHAAADLADRVLEVAIFTQSNRNGVKAELDAAAALNLLSEVSAIGYGMVWSQPRYTMRSATLGQAAKDANACRVPIIPRSLFDMTCSFYQNGREYPPPGTPRAEVLTSLRRYAAVALIPFNGKSPAMDGGGSNDIMCNEPNMSCEFFSVLCDSPDAAAVDVLLASHDNRYEQGLVGHLTLLALDATSANISSAGCPLEATRSLVEGIHARMFMPFDGVWSEYFKYDTMIVDRIVDITVNIACGYPEPLPLYMVQFLQRLLVEKPPRSVRSISMMNLQWKLRRSTQQMAGRDSGEGAVHPNSAFSILDAAIGEILESRTSEKKQQHVAGGGGGDSAVVPVSES